MKFSNIFVIMKMRTNKNSLRFRLNQTEVSSLSTNGFIEDCLQLGPSSICTLKYSLIFADHPEINISFSSNHIRIFIPATLGAQWLSSDQVGLEHKIQFNEWTSLSILLEKDFQCLTPRLNEDESNNFPNPLTKAC